MTNDEFTSQVDSGQWPSEIGVPLDTPFTDFRGVIQNLVLKPMTSVAVITSKRGTVRANHYHKTDWHYAYVISGSIKYYHRPVGSTEDPQFEIFTAGQMFFTPPMVDHTMVFTEDTTFITMARNVRSHESHEADLVRIQLIDPEQIKIEYTKSSASASDTGGAGS